MFQLLQLYSFIYVILSLHDFRIWPNHQIIITGSSVLFYCDSVVSANWTFLGTHAKQYNETSNSLFIFHVGVEDLGVYICRGVHKSGNYFLAKGGLVVRTSHVSGNCAIL